MLAHMQKRFFCLLLPFCALLLVSRPCLAGGEPTADTPLETVTFVVFDTETTGFDPSEDRILEIGAVKFRSNEVVAVTNWIMNPQRDIPYWAYRVHRIGWRMVTNQPPFKTIYPQFADFIKDSVLLAHNARFDVDFIAAELKRAGLKPPPEPVLDSLPLFRHWFPEVGDHTLEGLATYLGLDTGGYHRALADSIYVQRIIAKRAEMPDPPKTYGNLRDAAELLKF